MWIDCFAKATASATDCIASFHPLAGPIGSVRRLYSDGARATMAPRCVHTAPPSIHRSGGTYCARGSRRTTSSPHEIGIVYEWWCKAARCHCFLRNANDKIDLEKTVPDEMRHSNTSHRRRIPCGASLPYKSAAEREIAAAKTSMVRCARGCYGLPPPLGGGGGEWSGDYLVIGGEMYSTARRHDAYVHRVREVHCESP